jgi:hypothetical protein
MKNILLWNAALVLFVTSTLSADGELRAGFAQVDITPPIGAIITGPMGPASTGIADPLKARAMVVQNGERRLAIVGVDLVKVTRDLTDKIIALVVQQTSITQGCGAGLSEPQPQLSLDPGAG